VRGNPHAPFGKRPTEKDRTKGTSPAVDFTREEADGKGPDHGNLAGGPLHSMGGGWKRGDSSPRQSPTQPTSATLAVLMMWW
jgi:hypothetical protein